MARAKPSGEKCRVGRGGGPSDDRPDADYRHEVERGELSEGAPLSDAKPDDRGDKQQHRLDHGVQQHRAASD
jgi:hypothetical protein